MNAVAALDYGTLLSKLKPEVVRDEKQNQLYIQQLESLAAKGSVSPAEGKLIGLLTVLIEQYENASHPIAPATPVEIVRHLMEVHGLRQKDLVGIFGAESIVSEVLNGKREITKDQIRRLSSRFHVSPAVFF